MTRLYPVKSVRVDIHKDCFCKVSGIEVEVKMTPKQFDDVIPKRDLVSCEFSKGKFTVIKIYKN